MRLKAHDPRSKHIKLDTGPLLIVGATSFGAVVEALHPVQQQLSREINPKVFTSREWIAKRKQKNPFVLEVVGKPKIFLLGTENDLTELGRHKP